MVSQQAQTKFLCARLDSRSLKTIRSKALKCARTGFEICGALIREESGKITMRVLPNLAKKPARWLIERSWLTDIRRELKGGRKKLVGTFHSHVGGYAYPSWIIIPRAF